MEWRRVQEREKGDSFRCFRKITKRKGSSLDRTRVESRHGKVIKSLRRTLILLTFSLPGQVPKMDTSFLIYQVLRPNFNVTFFFDLPVKDERRKVQIE